MKRIVVKLVLLAGIILSIQSENSEVEKLRKVLEQFNNTADLHFEMLVEMFPDSISITPFSRYELSYWRSGTTSIIESEEGLQIMEADRTLVIDHESKTMVISSQSPKNDLMSNYVWDSLFNGFARIQEKTKNGNNCLQINYPWSSTISAAEFCFSKKTYQPMQGFIYSRMPLEYESGKWASNPKTVISYVNWSTKGARISNNIDDFIYYENNKVQATEKYKNYRLIDLTEKR